MAFILNLKEINLRQASINAKATENKYSKIIINIHMIKMNIFIFGYT